jgi:chorismate synthase
LSGVFQGKTLGTPIAVLVRNEDARPEAYSEMETTFRPSHADFTYQAKYGIRNWQGGGRASARETIGRVAAAAIALEVLRAHIPQIEILAWVKSIQHLEATVDPATVDAATIEGNIVRTGDPAMVEPMIEQLLSASTTA